MNKDKVILLVLESIEIAQSLIIAIFLIFLRFKNKKKSMLLLALFFLFYAIASVIQAGTRFEFIPNNLAPITSAIDFIAFAFFYAHINSLLINSDKKRVFRIFIISSIAFLIGIIISFSAFLTQSPLLYLSYNLYILFKFVFLLYVVIILNLKIKKHNNLVAHQYSNTENRKLQFLFYWTLTFVLFFIAFSFIKTDSYLLDFTETIVSLLWTLGLAYNAIFYQMSVNLFDEKETNNTTSFTKTIEEKSNENLKENKTIENETNETHSKLFEKIKQQIETNELFLNAEFTIAYLADLVDEHPKLVSQVINELAEQNFNTFINNYRVMYAKNMLLNDQNKHLNIEGIGNLSGFKSNSSFYTAFKKELKITPLQFQKQHAS